MLATLFHLLSTNTILVHIPIGKDGYDLSYIEAVGTICGLLCIWFASLEKNINYFFGLLNVTLFAFIFFQITLYANLLLQIFFFGANVYGWYAWTRKNSQQETELKIRWLSLSQTIIGAIVLLASILLLTFHIDAVFGYLVTLTVALFNAAGIAITVPVLAPDAYPFWDATMTVLSITAMILMTRKYVENWILWIIINMISIVIFALQGVYAMSLEYIILLLIAVNGTRLWMKSAKASAGS